MSYTPFEGTYERLSGGGADTEEVTLTAVKSAPNGANKAPSGALTVPAGRKIIVDSVQLSSDGTGDFHVFMAATASDAGAHTSILRSHTATPQVSTPPGQRYVAAAPGWKVFVKSQAGDTHVKIFGGIN